jgi:lipopolysaccharide assembly outer membrane protein LptD (OstA)
MYKLIYILSFLSLFTQTAWAQASKPKLIQIIKTGSLSYDKDVINAKILRGDVICEHEGALLYCDTAYIFEQENKMTARGHILITKGDSIRVTGETLVYDGKTRMATLTGNVKCIEKDMTLTTGLLTFDVAKSIANYYNGGTIVNKENTLVSKNGHYYSATKEAAFHYSVVLTNPDYKMNSDTLRYRIPNKTSYFFGPSIITSKTDYIYCENGWYDTDKEKSQFSKNAILVTKQQKLRGDSLVYDRLHQTGKAYRNVTLVDTSQKSIIYGNYIEYHQKNSEALVTKKAVYARIMEHDTLFIAADTLYHRDLDSVNYFLNAYHHVRVYKHDLQAIADSASLNSKDSLLKLFRSPVLWSRYSQATAKLIKVKITSSNVKGFELEGQAFLAQAVDSSKMNMFNQFTAKKIVASLSQDTIRKVVADGNVEIYYYPKNEKKIMGLNKTSGTEAVAWFKSGDVSRLSMRPKTTGGVDPIKEVDVQNAILKGFNWHYQKRPKSSGELFR